MGLKTEDIHKRKMGVISLILKVIEHISDKALIPIRKLWNLRRNEVRYTNDIYEQM